MRLIDADALKEKCFGKRGGLIHTSDVDNMPNIEIIRCRDCKHYKRYEYTGDFACHYVIGGTVRREPDDFCSRAERREASE